VYFCDIAPASLAALKQNLDACGVDGRRGVVIKADWRAAIQSLREKCNLVFIDAPYDKCEYYPEILNMLLVKGMLEQGAKIIIERYSSAGRYVLPVGFELLREKRYGRIGVDLLVYADAGEGE